MKLVVVATRVWLPLLIGPAASSQHPGSLHYDELFTSGAQHYDELIARSECTPYKILTEDTCETAATNCGISVDDLYKYNGNPSGSSAFCSTLKVDNYLCCSAGTMPSMGHKRATDSTCKYIQVAGGDSCSSIAASKCGGIKLDQLYKFNNLTEEKCRTIKPKQPICCTAGTKPDLRPKKNSDGSCSSYKINDGDICKDVADAHYLTLEGGNAAEIIHDFNKGKTWGWMGCTKLIIGQNICLSDGTPPMPSPIENATCGPQVPGTQKPKNSTKLANLNPCPLNVCCNIWGNCGITDDFCVDTTIDDTPGTAKNGTYGCISNCGMEPVYNQDLPDDYQFRRIGYFEGWNMDRPCLNMDVDKIDKDKFTTVHFAFGYIHEDFTVSAQGVEEQFKKFKKLTGVKKVISFGGWAFSNEAPTNHLMRDAVKPANAALFATNVYNFVMDNDLDGVDFDWEYPGATDIEGSDPGTPEDGANYLNLLTLVKKRFKASKSVAIAAPASYWYLRNFPIKKIGEVVDYIVYMTYDLHGQWDVANKWSMDGCEKGNCLRSHVNSTLTYRSLALITKAGVPQYKVVMGVTSYGRSFKMAELGCAGPDCTFLGTRDNSSAAPGECTGQSGYIANAEIAQIKAMADADVMGSYYEYHDDDSDSDIIVYNGNEWVGYMTDETKEERTLLFERMKMGGTSDWAIDLDKDYGDSSSGGDEDYDWESMDLGYDCHFDKEYSDLDELDAAASSLPYQCVAMHAIDLLTRMLGHSLDGYDAAADGYDGLFDEYADYMEKTLDGRLKEIMREPARGVEVGSGVKYFKCYAVKDYPGKREDAHEVDCDDKPREYMSDYTYFYELEDAKGFNATLTKEGIDAEWITYDKTWEDVIECPEGNNNCIRTVYLYHGYPLKANNIEIPDPKEIVGEARKNMGTLKSNYDEMTMEVGFESWDGNLADVVDILATPVFMLEDAVTQMKDIKEIGQEWKDEKAKALVLKILEGVLFLVPFLGAAIGNLGRAGAALARMLMAIDSAAGAGLSIYTIIEDPSMAPMAILEMLMGGLGAGSSRSSVRYRALASSKGKMSKEVKDTMGDSFKKNDPKVQSLLGKICPGKR